MIMMQTLSLIFFFVSAMAFAETKRSPFQTPYTILEGADKVLDTQDKDFTIEAGRTALKPTPAISSGVTLTVDGTLLTTDVVLGAGTLAGSGTVARIDEQDSFASDKTFGNNVTVGNDATVQNDLTVDGDVTIRGTLFGGSPLDIGSEVNMTENVNITSEVDIEKTVGATNTLDSGVLGLKRTSTGNMANGFGPGIGFTVEDNANTPNLAGEIGGIRGVADNSGKLRFNVSESGTMYQVADMEMSTDANTRWLTVNRHLTASATSGSLSNGQFFDMVLPAGFYSGIVSVTTFETANANSRRASVIHMTMRFGGFAQTQLNTISFGANPTFTMSSPANHTLRFTNNFAQPCTISVTYSGVY